MRRTRANSRLLCLAAALVLAASGDGPADDAETVLSVWYHTGQPREPTVIEDQVRRVDTSRPKLRVRLTLRRE
jgi:ABC-type glycerol-3-phosphate transport system substrate-binding protein